MRQEDVQAVLVFDTASWWSMADIIQEMARTGTSGESHTDYAHAHRILKSFEKYRLVETRQVDNPAPIQRRCKATITQWRWVG